MKQSKPIECHHRITSFQAHADCQRLAAICQRQCQQLHDSSNEVIFSSVDLIEEDFKILRERCKEETRSAVDRIQQSFREANQYLQKQQIEFLKEMEIDLRNEFYRSISLDKEIVEKIDNKRYERIKCKELFTFLETKNIDQHLRKSNLPNIIDKYKEIATQFKSYLLQAGPFLSHHKSTQAQTPPLPQSGLTSNQSSNKGVQLVNPPIVDLENQRVAQLSNHIKNLQQKIRNMQKINHTVTAELQKAKYDNKVLFVNVKNLRREMSKNDLSKVSKGSRKLSLKTWNILKVVTKKIKKPEKPIVQAEKELEVIQKPHLEQQRIIDGIVNNGQLVSKEPQNSNNRHEKSPSDMDIEEIDPNEGSKPNHQPARSRSSQGKRNQLWSEPDKKDKKINQEPVENGPKSLKDPLAASAIGNQREGNQKMLSDSEQQQSDFFTFFQKKLF